jgi:hypothetical protein
VFARKVVFVLVIFVAASWSSPRESRSIEDRRVVAKRRSSSSALTGNCAAETILFPAIPGFVIHAGTDSGAPSASLTT